MGGSVGLGGWRRATVEYITRFGYALLRLLKLLGSVLSMVRLDHLESSHAHLSGIFKVKKGVWSGVPCAALVDLHSCRELGLQQVLLRTVVQLFSPLLILLLVED